MGNTKSRKSKLVGQVKPILHEVLEQVATNFNNEDETTDIVACVAVIDPRDEKTPVLISMATPGRNLATGEDSKMVGIVANLMKTVVMFGTSLSLDGNQGVQMVGRDHVFISIPVAEYNYMILWIEIDSDPVFELSTFYPYAERLSKIFETETTNRNTA
eukprot:TRINITY_DN1261_c0_g2_i4.p1 TRINITY_DN1261_c0_g2~~TRINITY_DN1261_c0_g2_i4.p1  ORF type:complete len:159 (+),score=26.82 TRINITY_DN1261_c0_g2_i4:175-651(+)